MRTSTAAWLFTIALMTAGGSGCAGRKPAIDESIGGADLASLVLLEKTAPSGAVKAADIVRLHAGELGYLELDKDGRPKESILQRTASTNELAAEFAIDVGGGRREFLRHDDDGNVVMTAVLEEKDNALSLFEPPLVVAYAELPAGERRTSRSSMRVVDANDRTKQRERGTATRSIEYTADQRIRLPAGEFTAYRVDIEFRADLNMADAEEQTTLFVVPGQGMVAQLSREKVTVLGAFSNTTVRTLILDGVRQATEPQPFKTDAK